MKLTVIGGGGVRSMFLAKSIAMQAEKLGIDELVFMDIDADKLRIFGGMARHVAHMLAPQMRFALTTSAKDAIENADYVITTIRAGGDAARARDEHIALAQGVLGQETTGAAGFSFAMRSIPALVEYCDLVRRYAKPGARVFNFTNPVGIVTQALRDAGYDFTFGICDAPTTMLGQFADLCGVPSNAVRGEMFGLNHLSWFQEITLNGQNIMPQLLENPEALKKTDLHFFSSALLEHVESVPNEYLYYFYSREEAVANILAAGYTRGDDICRINQEMLKELSPLNPDTDFDTCMGIYSKWYGLRESRYMANETGVKREKAWRFEIFTPDAGGYAGVALRYIEIANSAQKDQMILCLPNQNAVDFLRPEDTVEVTCDIVEGRAIPHRFEHIPPHQQEMIRRVKYYERVGAQAILRRDRKLARECLMMHPLVNSWTLAEKLVDAYIAANESYTGKWN